jgi:hypothetical protein
MGVVLSGMGVDRVKELGEGHRRNTRAWITSIKKEVKEFPLGLSATVRHFDLVEGDLVCIREGKIVPFEESLPCAGILEGVVQGNAGAYLGRVITRAALSTRLQGVTSTTSQGSLIYATKRDGGVFFTAKKVGLPVGEICVWEASDKAVIGIRTPQDTRLFYTGGPGAARSAPRR